MEIFIDPFTDFGFKKLFGEDVNKDLLIDFLNELLKGREIIKNLTYLKNEHLSDSSLDRKAIFDLYCENERGQKFIVELQKVRQKFFKDRSIYYATFPIREQAQTGDYWNFELKTVYTIAIMDFVFDKGEVFHHHVQLFDLSTQSVFYDKLHFIYIEMPKFDKQEHELQSHYDKWMFVLKNLGRFQQRPPALQERIFQKFLDVAEIASFTPNERYAYRDSQKYKWDIQNSMDTYLDQGRVEGKIEGKIEGKTEMILKLLKAGKMDLQEIAQMAELSVEQVQEIAKEM